MANLAADLLAAIPALDAKDQDFARSMIAGHDKYGRFSDRQLPWVEKLIERANNAGRPAAARVELKVNLAQVNAMFDSARAAGKKKMALRFLSDDAGKFKVSPAGDSSANAGCLYVKAGSDYLGKITPAGEYKPAYGVQAQQAAAAHRALVAFCADPKSTAVLYGQTTGTCMFCGLELTDPRSKAVSYGPICAENYGLPWGG